MFHIAFIGGHPLSKVNEIISELDVFIIWNRVFLAVATHNFLFLCVDDEEYLFGLSIFFSAGYGLQQGYSQEFQSARSSGRSGKVVVSLSLLHHEIVDNDEQKGNRDSPPPPWRSLVMTSNSLVRWPSTYTALLKLVYRAIEVSTYGSGFRFVRNIPVKDGDLAVIYRYEYVTSHLFIKSKYFQAVVS